MSKAFNPNNGIIKVQGGREYLPVASRILWFRNEFPEWSITTELAHIDYAKQFAVFRCTILNEQGRVMAQATKMEDRNGFGDFLEKAETGSVGRALAFLGYGTLGARDFQEGERIADAPRPSTGPDERIPLLDALRGEAVRLGLVELIDDDSLKARSRFARLICNESGRTISQEAKMTAADISFAIENMARWNLERKAKAIAERPAQNDNSAALPDPDTDPDPPFEGGVLLDVPAPGVVVLGGYAEMEAMANRAGNAGPQGRKNARK